MSHSLRLHELQHIRLPCSSLSPRVCSDSWLCCLTSHHLPPLLLLPSIFPSIRIFSSELAFRIRWPEYWSFSFSISLYNKYSGLIFFRMDWFWSPCSPRDSQESSPAPQFRSINSSMLSLLYGPILTSVHDYWKNHSFDIWTFISKLMSLLFNMLSSLVIAFLARSKCLLIS